MKRKVLYIITGSDVGGAQKYVADLAGHLDPVMFEAKVLHGGRDLKWLSNRTMPWLLFANDWLAVFELVRTFRREQPDVIHLNSSKAGVVGSLAAALYKLSLVISHKSLVKVVFTAHGWAFNPTNHYAPLIRWMYGTLHRVAARLQDIIINVSGHDHTLALRYRIAPPEKLVTIHNGIDPNIPFLTREEARREILKRLGSLVMSHKSLVAHPWVGSLGRLTKEKDYGTLVAAAAQVPHASFFIIGSGPEAQQLKVISHKSSVHSRFFIVPPAGNDARLLKAFDVFSLSSIKEGFPYSLLEALAAGIPAVVTDAGGMPEIARRSSNVKTVPARNAAALAAEIQNALGQNTTMNPSIPFPLATMVTETAALYTTKPTEDRRVTA